MKQHVSAQQMKRLEAGEQVLLNLNQLEELQHYAPPYVDVYVHKETSAGFGIYRVMIKDTRPKQEIQPGLKQQLKQIYADTMKEEQKKK